MNFKRMSDWHEISDDGRYVVSAAHVIDRYRFQGFLLAPEKGKTSELLGTYDSAPEARQCCEDHEALLVSMRRRA
jgi:hypothetical protein